MLVWGDYDADGVTRAAILVEGLQAVGTNVAPYLPHRADEGYGLNRKTLENLIDTFDTLLTVDCGGSNMEEFKTLVTEVLTKHASAILLDPEWGHYDYGSPVVQPLGQQGPAGPIVLRQAILDRDDRIPLRERLVHVDHLLGAADPALPLEVVAAVPIELGGGGIERDRLHVTAEWQTRIIARLAALHGPPVRAAMRWRLRG